MPAGRPREKKYSLVDLFPKQRWYHRALNWIKRKFGYPDKSLIDLADTICQTNDLMKQIPWVEDSYYG